MQQTLWRFNILVIIMTRTLTRQELRPNHATTVLGQDKEIVLRLAGSETRQVKKRYGER
jgi:hypothetical protein